MTLQNYKTPLQQVAEERGYSLSRLRKETGMRPSTVFGIWHGQRLPRRSSLQKLAAVLKVDWQCLDPNLVSHDDGILLGKALEATGLSIHQLAKQAGLTYPTMRNIWHGYTLPQEQTLQKIAAILHIDRQRLCIPYHELAQAVIPTLIQQIAEAQGYSIPRLAQAAQISHATLLGAWYGQSQPQGKTLQKIAAVLHVDWRSLLPSETKGAELPLCTVVRQVAEARGLSARYLARQAGLHYLTVLNAWYGKCVPHEKTLRKLAVVLDVDWQELQEIVA